MCVFFFFLTALLSRNAPLTFPSPEGGKTDTGMGITQAPPPQCCSAPGFTTGISFHLSNSLKRGACCPDVDGGELRSDRVKKQAQGHPAGQGFAHTSIRPQPSKLCLPHERLCEIRAADILVPTPDGHDPGRPSAGEETTWPERADGDAANANAT